MIIVLIMFHVRALGAPSSESASPSLLEEAGSRGSSFGEVATAWNVLRDNLDGLRFFSTSSSKAGATICQELEMGGLQKAGASAIERHIYKMFSQSSCAGLNHLHGF